MATDSGEPIKQSAVNQSVKSDGAGSKSQTISPIPAEINLPHEHHHEFFPSRRSFINWLCINIVGIAGLFAALTIHHLYDNELKPGDTLNRDIYANCSAVVVDEEATENARKAISHSYMPVFKSRQGEDAYTTNKVRTVLTDIEQLKNKSGQEEITSNKAALAKLIATDPRCTEEALKLAPLVPSKDLDNYVESVKNATKRVTKNLQRLPETADSWLDTVVEFLPDDWNAELRHATASMICQNLRPNVLIDPIETQRHAFDLAQKVSPVLKHIAVGQLIVAKNKALTASDISVLKLMGKEKVDRTPAVLGLSAALLSALTAVAVVLFAIERKHLFATTSVGLIYIVAIIVFGVSSIFGKTFPQVVPLPTAALILSIFLGQKLALTVCAGLAFILVIDGTLDFANMVALCAAAGAAIGFYSRKRHALISTGVIMAIAQAIGYLGAESCLGTASPQALFQGVSFEFFAGMMLAILSIGSLPFLESMFGMITPFRLAELTDADQPLLRKLEENAPGTYQHSLAVANLAEAGARAIGADVNLVRAGAFYHDVGKMVRPRYFIENQLGDANPHDSMSPEDSRERVLAHVTDGIALAKEYKLPKAVQDFIPMHQGTSLMAYFYHKACLRDGHENVEPSSYRYPGPKPQSKETSIVMLADVSEAVTHSMKDPSQEEVEEVMAKVFQNRWDDGQFSEAGLTYNELQRVKRAFVHVWRTLHHERLKYPSTTTGRMAVPPPMTTSSGSATNTGSSISNNSSNNSGGGGGGISSSSSSAIGSVATTSSGANEPDLNGEPHGC